MGDKSQHGRKRQIESVPLPIQSFKMSVSGGKIEGQVAKATDTIVTFEQAPQVDQVTVESITELHVPQGDGEGEGNDKDPLLVTVIIVLVSVVIAATLMAAVVYAKKTSRSKVTPVP